MKLIVLVPAVMDGYLVPSSVTALEMNLSPLPTTWVDPNTHLKLQLQADGGVKPQQNSDNHWMCFV